MRYVLSLALVACPLSALAEDGGTVTLDQVQAKNQAVIGGTEAPAGKWPDAAALLWGGEQACTGTLIAPTLVLTAGHCIADGAPSYVLLNAVSETDVTGGERIRVLQAFEYPSSWTSIDAGVLVLGAPAVTAPRPVATGWARFDIKNGAAAALVGFGATDRAGNIDSPTLREAMSTITDFNCTASAGCNSKARPDGELGAGGNGIDTCPGDSGGPLYLVTTYGTFLAGITSRGYDDNTYYCSEGGIYGRADKLVEWIETTTGVKVTQGPLPTADLTDIVRGTPGEAQIVTNDPKEGATHTYAITQQPGYAKAAVNENGLLRVCPNADIVGGDSVKVTVTDAADPSRSVVTTIAFNIVDGDPDDSCDETAFGDEGGGCCDTRRSAQGSIPLVLAVGALLVRRRRRR